MDFHPFGEFFASGSLDTNLKIWDIKKKGCIHTYKGHTRGVNAIRFTPDGRWVVSGGEDNIVKVWDLTAGKLLHQFKDHEGQIQCLDFHPHEFLLATAAVLVALELVESWFWTSDSTVVVEVDSQIVLTWLLSVEQRPKIVEKLLHDFDSRGKKSYRLFYGKSEQNVNEMAFALAVVGVGKAKTFKAWW